MRWERTSPNLFGAPATISSSNLRPPFISAGPAPGSQQRPPHCSLPAQRLSVTGNMHTLNLAHVHVCVCAQCVPLPQRACPWRGAREPGGASEAATPGLISHSPENLPTILILLAGQTPPEGREGAALETLQLSPSMCSSPTPASSCTGA